MSLHERARWIASRYLGREIVVPYAEVSKKVSTRIASEYELAESSSSIAVNRAFKDLARQTCAQYVHLRKYHPELVIEFGNYPKPQDALRDIHANGHVYVLPTQRSYGTGPLASSQLQNLMLEPTPHLFSGQPTVVNDIFRLVHDYFGHLQYGNGFGPRGEEHAWRCHSVMYTGAARHAVTCETRGQNCWVNFGPHAEHNRTATEATTIFADQKLTLLPAWVTTQGSHYEPI